MTVRPLGFNSGPELPRSSQAAVRPHLAAVALGMQSYAERYGCDSAAIAEYSDNWQPTFAPADAPPPPMFRVGEANVTDRTVVMMGGLGTGHIALPASRRSLDIIQNALIRTSASVDPQRLRIDAWVPHGEYRDFNELGETRFRHIEYGGLEARIDQLARMQTEIQRGLRSGMGQPGNPWNVLLIDDSSVRLSDKARAQLQYLASGTEWGMLLMRGVPAPSGDLVQLDTPDARRMRCDVDSPTSRQVQELIGRIVDADARIEAPAVSAEIDEGPLGVQSTATGIKLVLGYDTRSGRYPLVELGDATPHMVIGGTSGGGKSALLARLMRSAAKFRPDELDVYYIDAAGPDGAILGEGQGEEPAYASLNLLATSVRDPEYVVDALRHIERMIHERETLLTRMHCKNITQLRREYPNVPMSRVLLVVDELPRLFTDERAVASMSNIVNTGRKLGIHVVMATLEIGGQVGRAVDRLLPQFGLRVSLKGGQWLMSRANTSTGYTDQITTIGHAWINKNLGDGPASENIVVRVPLVQSEDIVRTKQSLAWMTREMPRKPLIVFDGGEPPELTVSKSYQDLTTSKRGPVRVFVGQQLSVEKTAATAVFDNQRGQNLLILGADNTVTSKVVEVAAQSIARQHEPTEAKFSIVCLDTSQTQSAERLADKLRADGHAVESYDDQSAETFMTKTAEGLRERSAGKKNYIFVYGSERMDEETADAFKDIADSGPVRGVHLTAVAGSLQHLESTWSRDHRRDPPKLFEYRVVLDAPQSDVKALLGNNYQWNAHTRPGRAAFSSARDEPSVVALYS